jgi:hypothetical protein
MHSDFETPDHGYTIKILYGPLSGLEIPLAAGRHFFVSTSDADASGLPSGIPDNAGQPGETSPTLSRARNTYLVPGPMTPANGTYGQLPNFSIALGESTHDPVTSNQGALRQGDDEREFPARRADIPDGGSSPEADVEIYVTSPLSARATPLPRSYRLQEGKLFELGALRFAWKRNGSSWDFADESAPAGQETESSVALPSRLSSVDTERLSQYLNEGVPAGVPARPSGSQPSARRRTAWGVAIFSMIAAIAALSLVFNVTGSPPRLDVIETALQGAPARTLVRMGRDGIPYVLVQSERDATWAAQALRRIDGAAPARVRIERQEVERIEALLERQNAPYYVVRFDTPKQMSLILAADASPVSLNADRLLRDDVLRSVPYVEDVRINRYSPATIISKARTGLDALDIPYRQTRRGETTTFELDSTMDDARLAALGTFLQAFSREWGNQSAHFVIESATEKMPLRAMKIRSKGFVATGRDAIEFTSPVS